MQISDFGLSVKVGQSKERGTLKYCAPEVLQGHESSYASDVYSFGIILWELYTAKSPYIGLDENEIIMQKVGQTYVPIRLP